MTQINHPEYYQGDKKGCEVIDFIDAHGLGFSLGNAIKYIVRAGKKNGELTQIDLQKAIWYIDHYISKLKEQEAGHEQEKSQG